jgi:transposase
VEQILIKRDYNIPGLRFKYPKGTKYTIFLEYPLAIKQTYYLARILLNYQDFFKEKSQVKELIIDRGYKAMFLPKFYCEINPIEIYWRYSKTRYRQVKKASFPDTKIKVVEVLEACLIKTIQRFCNCIFYWIDIYRKGLSIK